MPIQAGSRLGPYELTAPIGAGGMGEVWRGRDTRLDRSVAVKILPAGFAQDGARLGQHLARLGVLRAVAELDRWGLAGARARRRSRALLPGAGAGNAAVETSRQEPPANILHTCDQLD